MPIHYVIKVMDANRLTEENKLVEYSNISGVINYVVYVKILVTWYIKVKILAVN
jgi:hypothetical protein